MILKAEADPQEEPDIVLLVLQRVRAVTPALSEEAAQKIEQQVRAEYGGRRLFVPKGAKRLTPEQREAVFKDGLSNMPTSEITTKHKISRATLYREMKKGGRFGDT